jgi:polysaccharide pyruvyl transferase WcaK-like protein
LQRVISRLAGKPQAILAELGFLARSYAAVRQTDTFILSGSGQFLDSWGGAWEYPFTLAKWMVLAKLAGAKCYVLNAGAGPLQHPLSQFFVRQALRLADYVALRDEPSRALLRQIGYKGPAEVCHDSVYCYDAPVPARQAVAQGAPPVVGLAPMAYCDPRRYCVRDATSYQRFVDTFAAFGARLSQRNRLILFSTDIWFDADTLSDVAARLHGSTETVPSHILPCRPISSIDTLLPQMAAMDYVVTARFHGVIFAHLLNIPVVAISHHPKVATLMADLGLSDYCLDIDSLEAAQLEDTFERMVANAPRIKARLAETATRYRRELNEQFNRLFPACPRE